MADVLVIDDDQAFSRVLCHAIIGEGFQPIAAESSRDVLELVRKHRPRLILLDVVMPGLNGLQLLAALKADPLSASIPVIVVTAMATDDVTKQAMGFGAAEVLYKTRFTMIELRQVLRMYLKKKRSA